MESRLGVAQQQPVQKKMAAREVVQTLGSTVNMAMAVNRDGSLPITCENTKFQFNSKGQ